MYLRDIFRPVDPNWQMTVFFLLALALLGFVMKLIALLLPATTSAERWPVFWLLPSPNSIKRSRPAVNLSRVLGRASLLFGAVALCYWIYWRIVRVRDIEEIVSSYLAAPILLLMSELLLTVATLFWLPSGRLLPPLHDCPMCAKGVADFWGRRWNLWFSDWFRQALFSRLRRRPVMALMLVFFVSGVMHEWAINVPLYFVTGRALFGSMMLYFLIQAAGVLFERRFLKKHSRARVLFAWLVVFVPVPLVINEGLLRVLHLWTG